MLRISRQQLEERFDALPQALRELLCTPQTGDAVWSACEANHLPEEKTEIIAALVGDVLFGFLHSDEFAQAITKEAGIDPKVADLIVQTIDGRIFAPVRNDLRSVFNPPSATPTRGRLSAKSTFSVTGPRSVPLDAAREATSRISFAVPQRPVPPPAPPLSETAPPGTEPLIIHEQKPVAGVGGEPMKKFSLPFSFTKPKSAMPTSPRATVEAPGASRPISEEEKPRVVHFGGGLTPLSRLPAREQSETINLDTFQTTRRVPEMREPLTPPQREPEQKPIRPPTSPAAPSQAPTPPPPPIPPAAAPPAPQKQVSLRPPQTSPAPPPVPQSPPRVPRFSPPPPPPASRPFPPMSSNQKSPPKIDGNTIDLRNQQPPGSLPPQST